jgi:hypothetical protein
MSEAAQDGTSLLSQSAAVDLLLSQSAPVEEQPDVSEEPQVEEEALLEPEAEADEVEVEAEAEDDEAEEVEYDEPDAEDEPDEAPTELTYRVRVGEEEVDVPLSELTNSYMRQSDYTRKTQQVAEQRKAAEAELAEASAQRQRYAEQLAVVEQALSQQEPSQEYWDTLYQSDPLEYTRQRDLSRERKDALEQIKVEQQRVQQEHMGQLQAAAQKRLAEEQERMKELIPEWLDAEVAQREKTAVITYAQRVGYTPEELSQVSDARAVAVIRKAMMYDELMAKKPAAQKKTAQAPKMTKGGQPKSKAQISARRKQSALAQISKSKGRASMDAAVDFLLTK